MKEKIVEILNDEDSYIPAEWLIYSKSNSAILIIKNEIDALIVQLKIAVKAGDFDDYFEREAPALFEKLSLKREELIALLHYERTKEKRKDIFRVDIQPFAIHEQQVLAVPNPAPMIAEVIAPTKVFKHNKSLMAKASSSYSDAKFYNIAIVGIFLISIQLLFNFTFENRLKNNVQETVVQNLENRLRLAENKNINLAHDLTQIRHRSLSYKTTKNGVPLLAPVKFKQDPVLTKLYEKEKYNFSKTYKKMNAKQTYAVKSQRKVYSLTKAKPKNKVSAVKLQRYSRRN